MARHFAVAGLLLRLLPAAVSAAERAVIVEPLPVG